MKYQIRKIAVLAVIFSLSWGAYAQEGVFMLSETKATPTEQASRTEMYLTTTKMLLKNSGAGHTAFIFDGASEVFTYIDHHQKVYYEFDKPTIIQLKQQIKMMVSMMQQFASQMPADQKSKLDKLLNPSRQSAIEYRKNSTYPKVGKWKTTGYEGLENNKKVVELNIASYQTIGIAASKFGILRQVMTYFMENLKEVLALLPKGGAFAQISFDENSPIFTQGIPIQTMAYEGETIASENTVEKIERRKINSAQFAIPSNYTRKNVNLEQIGR